MARAPWLPPNTSRVGRSATRPSWRAAAARSPGAGGRIGLPSADRKSTRLNSSHTVISYAVFCLKKKKHDRERGEHRYLILLCAYGNRRERAPSEAADAR